MITINLDERQQELVYNALELYIDNKRNYQRQLADKVNFDSENLTKDEVDDLWNKIKKMSSDLTQLNEIVYILI